MPADAKTTTQPVSINESQPKEQGDKGAVQQAVDAVGQGNAEREITVLDEKPTNNNIKITQDGNEQQIAEQRLTAEDNHKQEPVIKAIEGKAESDRKTGLIEAVGEAGEVIKESTAVVDMPISEIKTDTEKYQNRVAPFSEKSANKVATQYDPNKFDPIVLYKHPDGNTYVLSGHSRLEGMRRRGEKTIPARLFEGTPKAAEEFAQKSNKFNDLNSEIESAAYYRKMREDGVSANVIEKEAKEQEQQGAAKRVVSLSFLNPKGKTHQALEALDKGEGDTKDNIVKVAQKVGEIRKQNPHLTDAHENELFEHFIEDADNIPTDKELNDQNSLINRSISAAKFYNKEPLNLQMVTPKSDARLQWEKEKSELEKQLTDLKKEVNPNKTTGWNGLKEKAIALLARGKDKGSIDQAERDFNANKNNIKDNYEKQLAKKKDGLKALQDKLAKHLLQEKNIIDGDKAQISMFNATTKSEEVTPEQQKAANKILSFLKKKIPFISFVTDAKDYARVVSKILGANNFEGIRHSFISNKNANLFSGSFNGKTLADNFNKAVEMDGKGEPSERIKFATGWFKAGDGKWRYEVTDKDAKLKVSLPKKSETITAKLEDILYHPRLFEIYPQLKNTDVIITNNNINSDYGGFFISEHGSNPTPTIHVNTRGEINATISELIHEVQHNVQAISGLTPGKNNEAILDRLKDEFRSKHRRNPGANEERKLFIEANREYLGTYGEIEARASQHNIHLTENERLFNSTIAGTIKRFGIKPEDVSFPIQNIEINKGGNVINYLSTSQGDVYGFVHDGKIYLDPAKLSPELIAEEFTHIQQQALRLAARKGDKQAKKIVSAWDNATSRVADEFVKGVQGDKMSEYVRDLLNLLGITKAEMASEVYQRQPNESAAAYKTRLQDELWAKAQKPEFAKHLDKLANENKLTYTTRKIYEALKDFAKYIAKTLRIYNPKEWDKLSLPELIERTNRELGKDKWLKGLEKGNEAKAQETARKQAEWSNNLQKVNETFNNELQQLIDGKLAKGHILKLGNAGAILQSTGIGDKPIELAASLLKAKSEQAEHPFDLSEVKDLGRAIQNPLAVFNSSTVPGRKVIFTELSHTNEKGQTKNFVVALEVNSNRESVEIHSIRSVYPRENIKIIKSLARDAERNYVDKPKMLEWLDKQQSNSADVTQSFKHDPNVRQLIKIAKQKIQNHKNPISDADVDNVRWNVGREITLPDGTKKTVRRIAADVVNGFYSPIENAVHGLKQEKGTATQMLQMIKQGKGVKPDELQWTGVEEWLQGKGNERVTKQEILDYMKDNRVQLVEVVKSDVLNFTKEDISDVKINQHGAGNWVVSTKENVTVEFPLDKADDKQEAIEYALEQLNYDNATKRATKPKFSQYQLPGEKENYREVLVTLPSKTGAEARIKRMSEIEKDIENPNLSESEKQKLRIEYRNLSDNAQPNKAKDVFRSTHFNEPNIVGHLRMSDRVDEDGNKVLHIEEMQSDWGQAGKKEGFGEKEYVLVNDKNEVRSAAASKEHQEKVWAKELASGNYTLREQLKRGTFSPAPFVTNTSAWTKLLAKYAIKEAVKSGADKITWTSGETQNDRYDLSKQVDDIWVSEYADSWNGKKYEKLKDVEITLKGDDVKKLTVNESGKVTEGDFKGQSLDNIVGKEVAEKIINAKEETNFGEQDLKIGGSGMKGFYGSPTDGNTGIVGKAFQEAVKDITGEKNVRIGETKIDIATDNPRLADYTYNVYDADGNLVSERASEYIAKMEANKLRGTFKKEAPKHFITQHNIDITPEIRQGVSDGIPMFNIVGENANLSEAQKVSFANAEALDKKGVDADKIWAATGWQKDENGKWQTDASPVKVPQSLVDKFKQAQNGEIISEKLGDLVDLGELRKLYPELAELQVEIFNNETTEDYANIETVNTRDGKPIERITINSRMEISSKYNSSGYYTGSRPSSNNRGGSQRGMGIQQVGRKTSDFGQVQLTQLLTHEIQHWVQQKEGWPTASNLSKHINGAKNKFIAEQRQQVARFKAEGNSKAAGQAQQTIDYLQSKNATQIAEDKFKTALASQIYNEAYENYLDDPGEAQSRNAAIRAFYTAEQKKNTPISKSRDTSVGKTDSNIQFQLTPDTKPFETGDKTPATLENLQEKFKDAEVVQSEGELPQAIQDEIKAQKQNGKIKGVYHNGKVYMVADNIKTLGEAEGTYRHETLGHKGVIEHLGTELDSYATSVVDNAKGAKLKRLQALAARYGLPTDLSKLTVEQKSKLGQEYIAHVSENKSKMPQTWNEIATFVRKALRAFGIKLQVSDTEIQALIGKVEKRANDVRVNTEYSKNALFLTDSDLDANGKPKPEVLEEIQRELAQIEREAKANGTYHKAPNSKQSKLSEEQWVMVRTKRFKDWFGNWENISNLNNQNSQNEQSNQNKRLFPEEEQGRNSSGEINVLATSILQRLHQATRGKFGNNSRELATIKQSEEEYLEEFSKNANIWKEKAEEGVGEFYDNGQENSVYIDPNDTRKVTKLNNVLCY